MFKKIEAREGWGDPEGEKAYYGKHFGMNPTNTMPTEEKFIFYIALLGTESKSTVFKMQTNDSKCRET